MGESILMSVPLSRAGDGTLWCEQVPLPVIAERAGTPCYVYSANTIRDQYATIVGALEGIDARVHYSVKANSNLAVLSLLREMGAGVDIVSGGELFRVLKAGFAGSDVVFSGVGKTAQELESALRAGVKSINVESISELDLLHEVAQRLDVVAPVALRVNPDVSVETPHPYTRTGEHGMKFGIPDDLIVDVARATQAMSHVSLVGIAAHLGSQISQPEPYVTTIEQLYALCEEIRGLGITTLRYLDIGGGFAVSYHDDSPADLNAFADAVRPVAERSGLQLLIEPGRYIVAEAGLLLTRVVHRKHSGGKEIVITDGAMNDLIRPSLYDAYHRIEAVSASGPRMIADVVGPICESGDFFGLDREIAQVERGDLLVILHAGAYGFAMASNYNSRLRAPEVLVDGSRYAVVTARETYDDLIRCETLTPTWSDV